MTSHLDLLKSLEPDTPIAVRLLNGVIVKGYLAETQHDDAVDLITDTKDDVHEFIPFTSILTWIW